MLTERLPFLLRCASIIIFSCTWSLGDSPAAPHFHSGLAYERLGRLDEAYTELQLAVNLDPEDAQASLALGVVAMRLGHYDEALRAIEHSVALDANSCASYYELGFLYEKKGLSERALESWQRFLGLSRDDVLKSLARRHMAYLQDPA